MSKYKNQFARIDTMLVASVADSGTFTVSYPSGFTRESFTKGQSRSGEAYMIVNDNDRFSAAAGTMSLSSYGASTITITNSSGAALAAGSRVSIYASVGNGNEVVDLQFRVNLATITGAQDVVSNYYPGLDGVIEYFGFVVDQPVTTASKAATFNLEISTTDLTGGVIALTSAAATPMGTVIDGTLITAGNRIAKNGNFSIEASSVTAFSEGTGTFIVRIRADISDEY